MISLLHGHKVTKKRTHVCKIHYLCLIIIYIMYEQMRAPVAMFVYNRLDNTRRTVEALLTNTLAGETDLFVFSDGGKDEASWRAVSQVRDYLHKLAQRVELEHCLHSITLVERPENFYLERNITEGIAQVLQQYDRIIVLEDDIVTSPYYLQYMNEAFELYRDVPRVMHVAGFTNLSTQEVPFYFTPHMSGWGWGTWRDRWLKHFRHYSSRVEALEGLTPQDEDRLQYGGVFPCLRSLDRQPIPWDICWEIAIYRAGGLCLTPGQTMVRNVGLRNGTHFRSWDILQWYEFDREPRQEPLPLRKVECPEADPAMEAAFAQAIRDWGIRYTWLGKIVRKIYRAIRPAK